MVLWVYLLILHRLMVQNLFCWFDICFWGQVSYTSEAHVLCFPSFSRTKMLRLRMTWTGAHSLTRIDRGKIPTRWCIQFQVGSYNPP